MKIIIITAAWRAKNLPKVIEAINNQIYQKWHHIIINDGNPEVEEFFKRNNYFKDDKRRLAISFWQRTHWFGCYVRNTGIMLAHAFPKKKKGDERGVVFFDDDNMWYPNYLSTFVEMHEKRPNATLLGVDMETRSKKNPNYVSTRPCIISSNLCDLGGFLYKLELFDKYGYFMARPEKKITFDIELILKMAEGEGEDKIYIKHIPTWIFYYKEYKG